MNIRQAMENSIAYLREHPEQHGPSSLAEDEYGAKVSPFSKDACMFCVLGRAAIEMNYDMDNDKIYYALNDDLKKEYGISAENIWRANDRICFQPTEDWNSSDSLDVIEKALTGEIDTSYRSTVI